MQGSELSRGQGKDVNETLVLTYGMARHSGLGVVLICRTLSGHGS